MSKREGNSKVPENIAEQKKPKLNEGNSDNQGQGEAAAPEQRPNSPIAGPSSAPSDPQLRASLQTGLIPIYRYFDPRVLQESSSQSSTSIDFEISSSSASASNTTSSTNAEAGTSDSGTGSSSTQAMDVDSEMASTTSSSSSSTNTEQLRKHRHRKHKSQ